MLEEKEKQWFSEGRKSFLGRGLFMSVGRGGGGKRISGFLKGESVGERVI